MFDLEEFELCNVTEVLVYINTKPKSVPNLKKLHMSAAFTSYSGIFVAEMNSQTTFYFIRYKKE